MQLAETTTLTHEEIAKLTDCERTTVTKVLGKYNIYKQDVEDYRANRADIFAGLQERITKSISDDEIKKAPLGTRITMLGIIYDKERLESGQSTLNASIRGISNEVISTINQFKELRSALDTQG